MRKWIEIIEQAVITDESVATSEKFIVLMNPTPRQTRSMRERSLAANHNDELRASLIRDTGDLYIWSAFDATHETAMKELGIRPVECLNLQLHNDAVVGYMMDEIDDYPLVRKNPYLRRIYGDNFKIIGDHHALAEAWGHQGMRLGPQDFERILRSQRELEGLKAAIRDPETGKVYVGWSHQQAIQSVPHNDTTGAYGRLSQEWHDETANTGFVNRSGEFISRDEANERWGVLTAEDIRDKLRSLRR